MQQVITVFGSAQGADGDAGYGEAHKLGEALARAGFALCNGGYGGTMEASAKGAHEAGGTTIGITIARLPMSPNRWVSKVVSKPTLMERLQSLIDTGDGYVILRGGTGTLLELALVWELLTKHLMQPKPVVCLGRFWEPLVERMKEQLTGEGRIAASQAVTIVESPEECVRILAAALR